MTQKSDDRERFERLASQDQPGIVAEFYEFLRDNKKWWLVPILVVIATFGIFAALAGTGVAPFIYTMF